MQLVFSDESEKERVLKELHLQEVAVEITEDDIMKLDEEEPTLPSRKFSKEEIIKDEEKKEIPQKMTIIQ